MSHILNHCWRSDNFLGLFEELILFLFILYDDLRIFDTQRPLQRLFLLLEAYNHMVNLLTHHTEIQMVTLLLQLLHFFYRNRVILILLSNCAIDIDILVVRADDSLFILYFFALVERKGQSGQINLYLHWFYLLLAGLAGQQLTLNSLLLLLHIHQLILQLLVPGLETIQHELAGVDMLVRFVHGFLEARYGSGCVCGVIEGKGIVEGGDVLFHVGQSQQQLGIHRIVIMINYIAYLSRHSVSSHPART